MLFLLQRWFSSVWLLCFSAPSVSVCVRVSVCFLLRCCYPMRALLSEPLFLCVSPTLAPFLPRSVPPSIHPSLHGNKQRARVVLDDAAWAHNKQKRQRKREGGNKGTGERYKLRKGMKWKYVHQRKDRKNVIEIVIALIMEHYWGQKQGSGQGYSYRCLAWEPWAWERNKQWMRTKSVTKQHSPTYLHLKQLVLLLICFWQVGGIRRVWKKPCMNTQLSM